MAGQSAGTVPAATTAPASGTCAACGEELTIGAAFCEACGAPARDAPTKTIPTGTIPTANRPAKVTEPAGGADGGRRCPACPPGSGIDPDGYCVTCGKLIVRERDHVEIDVSAAAPVATPAAAVTDRGVRHHRNEDAVWLSTPVSHDDNAAHTPPTVNIVVADGVSTSFDPDVASAAAVTTAGAVLDANADPDSDPVAAVDQAIRAATRAVADLANTGDPRRRTENPACTIVVATMRYATHDSAGVPSPYPTITYDSVGDSRAYWVPATGPAIQLTEDDSWAAEAIRNGMPAEQAWQHEFAHAVLRWLGADADPVSPQPRQFTPDSPGLLLLCSDGFWNYRLDPQELADTVRAHVSLAAGQPSPMLELARSLTQLAIDAGGDDNITIAVTEVSTPEP